MAKSDNGLISKNELCKTTGMTLMEVDSLLNFVADKNQIATFDAQGEPLLYWLKEIAKILRTEPVKKALGLSTPKEIYQILKDRGLVPLQKDSQELMTSYQMQDILNREAKLARIKHLTTTIDRSKDKKGDRSCTHRLFRTDKTIRFICDYLFGSTKQTSKEASVNVIEQPVEQPAIDTNFLNKMEAFAIRMNVVEAKLNMLESDNAVLKQQLIDLCAYTEQFESEIETVKQFTKNTQKTNGEKDNSKKPLPLIPVDADWVNKLNAVWEDINNPILNLSGNQMSALASAIGYISRGVMEVGGVAFRIVNECYPLVTPRIRAKYEKKAHKSAK